mmetsp:Transcript_42331/g.78862  ORF Transcript_42331/g.78862 Transcript_42331/m.78862 type:complete len:205 (-) Transcript_42331:126-740(-)
MFRTRMPSRTHYVAIRALSMPSRADTQPMVFRLIAPLQAESSSSFVGQFSAGLVEGREACGLVRRLKRRQLLSPLVPAEAVLRAVPQAKDTALVVLAEHTLTCAAAGSGCSWVVRDGAVVASTNAEDVPVSSFNFRLRPGDVVALTTRQHGVAPLAEAADVGALVLRCELMASHEAWSQLGQETPHPSWKTTIFNEYGTHDKKL